MSDWYNDPQFQNTPEEPRNDQTPPAQEEVNPSGWSSAPSEEVPQPPQPPVYTYPPQPPTYPNYGWAPQPPQPPKKKKNSNTAAVLIAVLAVVCVGSLVASLFMIGSRLNSQSGKPSGNSGGSSAVGEENKDAPSIITVEPEEEGLTSREIVSANLNSTVIIHMYSKSASNGFFIQETETEIEAGHATGIVWTADGYIITNAHCVYSEELGAEFSRVEVELYDGTVYESAQIVGYDNTTDLAVIKVDAKNLTPATFGDSDALQLGDRILVLGNNSGLGWSATGGMVSGLARDVYEETNYAIKCLQVDAVINPGNSGGPLLNSSGQVVGINSAKIVATGYEGLGFSIPFNEAKGILEDLVRYGYVKGRIMLGIEGYTFDRYSGYEGFYISAISRESSFGGTSVQVGDIITHVDGVRVKSYAEMREQLTANSVGDQVEITLIRIDRNSRRVNTFNVTITLLESDGRV